MLERKLKNTFIKYKKSKDLQKPEKKGFINILLN